MSITKIRFEDHGQDFLEWVVNSDGIVTECKPFQGFLWETAQVIEPELLSPGDVVRIRLPISGVLYETSVLYPIESITAA